MTQRQPARLPEIDSLRGICVLLMIVFHLLFDLYWLGIAPNWFASPFWNIWGKITAIGFLLIVGVTLQLWYRVQPSDLSIQLLTQATIKRAWRVLVWASVITGVTWLINRELTVWFGILHLIGISTATSGLWLRHMRVFLYLYGLGFLSWWLLSPAQIEHHWLLALGFSPPMYSSFDYFPIFPWLLFIVVGVGLAQFFTEDQLRHHRLNRLIYFLRSTHWLQVVGRHSLSIYLIHQPILIAALWLFLSKKSGL